MSDRGAELRAKYGKPEFLEPDVSGQVFVFGHKSQEAAEAFVKASREDGYIASAEQRDGRWCSVVDLSPVLAEIKRNFKDGVL